MKNARNEMVLRSRKTEKFLGPAIKLKHIYRDKDTSAVV
jgi:hypothetical protein